MRWLLVAAGLVFGGTTAGSAGTAELLPGDLLRPAWLRIDYERPWPGLAVERGRAAVGLPLGRGAWLGARAQGLGAPTASETSFGAWAALGAWAFVAGDRTEVWVEGLDAIHRLDVEGAVQATSGPLFVGWATEVQDLRGTIPRVWRHWWIGMRRSGIEVTLGRRISPWRSEPSWNVGVRFALAGGVESVLGWRDQESVLALSWAMPVARVTAATAWSGPRAGAFSFRLRAGGG